MCAAMPERQHKHARVRMWSLPPQKRWGWPITGAQLCAAAPQGGDLQAKVSTCMAQGALQGTCMQAGFQGKALVGAPMAAGGACTVWALWGGANGVVGAILAAGLRRREGGIVLLGWSQTPAEHIRGQRAQRAGCGR